jgi:hypothetical protein
MRYILRCFLNLEVIAGSIVGDNLKKCEENETGTDKEIKGWVK